MKRPGGYRVVFARPKGFAYSVLGRVARPEGFAYGVLGGNGSTHTPHRCPPAEAAHPFGRADPLKEGVRLQLPWWATRSKGFAYSVLGGNGFTYTQNRCPPAEAAHPFGRAARRGHFITSPVNPSQ